MATRGEQHTSQVGLDLITSFEGFRSQPYQDSVGVWTIGYGHTSGVGPNSKPITLAQARALLQAELKARYEPYVNALNLPLNQNQFDALVSFVYNLGPGYFAKGSTMGDALRARQWSKAANAFLLYDHAGGQVLEGLRRRRVAERKLFLTEASPVVRWRAELTKRRAQLQTEKSPGARHYLIRRINALKDAIKKSR
jgi:lysozyme